MVFNRFFNSDGEEIQVFRNQKGGLTIKATYENEFFGCEDWIAVNGEDVMAFAEEVRKVANDIQQNPGADNEQE